MAVYDYYVTEVQYDKDNTHIQKLKVHKRYQKPDGEWLWDINNPVIMSRAELIKLIESGKTVGTKYKNREGKYETGAQVKPYEVTREFLRTVDDDTTRDNLENLPTF